MGGLDDYKPTMVMLGLQVIYAGVTLFSRAALLQEMSPRVFVVYRQAAATLVMASIAFLTRRKRSRCCLGWRSFCLIFLTTVIGVTLSQNIYFEGLYLASSSTASAMGNLVPAVTFVLASIVGLEKVNLQSLTSIAKIIGTALCVSGAVAMALLKGPKLLNTELLPPTKSLFGSGGDNWLLGCLLLFGSTCCWSLWLILQVSVCASYPDHLSLSAWMCFLATLQSATVTLFLEQDLEAWNMHSCLEITACLFTGVAAGVAFFTQAWCIERRGPLFSAMFNPLSTVIVALFASIFLHEEIYTGSLVGTLAVIIGLYVVLWGKAKEHEETNMETATRSQSDQTKTLDVLTDESTNETTCKIDLEEPLLCKKSGEVGEN